MWLTFNSRYNKLVVDQMEALYLLKKVAFEVTKGHPRSKISKKVDQVQISIFIEKAIFYFRMNFSI